MEGWAAILEWAEWRHRGLRGRDGAGHAVHPRAVAPAPREDPAAYLSACHPWPRDRLKIGIDAHFVGVREGGNERHFESIIRCLAVAARPEDEYFVFSYRGAARQRVPNGRLTHVPLRRRSVVWQRAVELLFERLALRWEIAGAPIERQRELLARFRAASPEERAWVRGVLREHCAAHFPDVRAP